MPQVGQRVSEYVLEERLGKGTFGEVWRGRHHVWADQMVAIKIPTEPGYIRNLQREGSAIHGLQHPSIVRAMGFDPYADPPYLVMEYVPGTSLRPLIEQRAFSLDDALAVMRQILSGLQHAHENGVIHRDMKPENVLVHEKAKEQGYGTPGMIKVTDFGLGKAANLSGKESIAFSMSMGGEDAKRISGTIDYMSPEQRAGEDVDARADLYACGVMFYELLTGQKPAGLEAPSELNPAVPKSLDEVFRRAYARLEKRYQSAAEFLAALPDTAKIPPLPQALVPPPLPPSTARRCPNCGRNVAATDQFCMHCGAQIVEWVLRCPQCGGWPDPTDKFCMRCGASLGPKYGLV